MFVVVTAFAVWLGRQVNVVRERKAMRDWLNDGNSYYVGISGDRLVAVFNNPATIPIWRRWLGDEPVEFIGIFKEMPKTKVDDVQSLFPEAIIQTPPYKVR